MAKKKLLVPCVERNLYTTIFLFVDKCLGGGL